MKICALASGSNGNAYYIEHQGEAILVDAGISRRQLLQRMKEKRLNIASIKAVFISHEHADHIRGFRVLCDMQKIPGYISQQTMQKCRKDYLPDKVVLFNPGDVVRMGAFEIHCFAKQHDAADPCSFRIQAGEVNVGVMTDIGASCDNVRNHLALCHAVFLESNYDEQLLQEGPYPYYLKQRVASDRGHLSNNQAVNLVENINSERLHTILLSHISADNNRPELAMNAFAHLNSRYRILPTNRYAPGDVLEIGETVGDN
ncbi:MAG: MBL fold metallo-hydrolase [Breznakibacter sp.]